MEEEKSGSNPGASWTPEIEQSQASFLRELFAHLPMSSSRWATMGFSQALVGRSEKIEGQLYP
jgi:hypothetical protein